MVVFPNAKINLGLNIISKRPDGYHELETCFYPVPWREALEIIEVDKLKVTTSGNNIPSDGENICLIAYRLIKTDYDLPPVHIHLHKMIPIGAGLGGGSADGAFTLSLLNNLFSLGLSDNQLMEYAVKLGADCSFFIRNKPMYAWGIGEQLEEINISLTGKFLLLVYPDLHISTKEAYAFIEPRNSEMEIKKIIRDVDIYAWKNYLKNDFEASLFQKYPLLSELKRQLYSSGAIYAAMSGSGSCMYGIFEKEPELSFPKDYTVWSGII